jgi:DNA-binding transcriptional ArsR family regulator
VNTAGAISDAVRVEILELLRADRCTAGEIAGHFSVSRPAVSRHLRVLREAGLVKDELVGRERIYSLEVQPLRELAAWLGRFLAIDPWASRMDALETEVFRRSRKRGRDDERALEQGEIA